MAKIPARTFVNTKLTSDDDEIEEWRQQKTHIHINNNFFLNEFKNVCTFLDTFFFVVDIYIV